MFVCNFCRQVTKPRVKCNKIVFKSVMFNHPHRARVLKRWGVDKQGKKKLEWVDDRGGVGPQVEKEINACPDCAEQYFKRKEAVTKSVPLLKVLAPVINMASLLKV